MKKRWMTFVLLAAVSGLVGCAQDAQTKLEMPDSGWHLWPDAQAKWTDDALFLPDEVDLKTLPINPPTGGWGALDAGNDITVSLPTTVEQHFWGGFGFRPYTAGEYTYTTSDAQVHNGNYRGVSWWWRDIDVPGSFANKVVLLHIRGQRQRAEVYVNQQLVGYDMVAETSFDCDISKAVKPGQKNRIAIRITNPGGRMDWIDFQTLTWGKYTFQKSHGFGGLDRGIALSAHDPVYLSDLWVLNTPQVRTVTAHALLRNETNEPESGLIGFDVIDSSSGQTVATSTAKANVAAHATAEVTSAVTDPSADLWSTDSPRLYTMKATWTGSDASGGTTQDTAEKRFGFRWFEPRGVGQAAGLYLNDARVRLYTAISWGFWGFNGLWPTPELARKEVTSAKALGMNCLNFHRDIGKEEVLADQDEMGLMRYMEAGGGDTTIGPKVTQTQPAPTTVPSSGIGGDPSSFAEKYEETKIMRMIQQFRSHPSLVIYVIQNETDPDLSQPRVFNLIRKMHALDPSRVIAAKSGIDPNHQVWMAPYDDTVHYDDGTGYSGWRDEHTVGGPGVWQDSLYENPEKFTHRIDNQKQIVDWGEMLGGATPDNHPIDIQQILSHGGKSYDLQDHQEVDAAYNKFLDRWNFRSAFPSTEALFKDVGNKAYEFWGRVIETARLAEGNDIFTMSGWESTAIENHSGLVDNLRNLKGDPALMRPKFAPLLPVAKPRGTIFRVGDQPIADLYLINETGKPAAGKLSLRLKDPAGATTSLGDFDAPAFAEGRFVYPIQTEMHLPALNRAGEYTLSFALDGATPATNHETLRVVNTSAEDLPEAKVGIIGDVKIGGVPFTDIHRATTQPYSASEKYDLLVVHPPALGHTVRRGKDAKTKNAEDQRMYEYSLGSPADVVHFAFSDLPAGKAKVTLFFADPESVRVDRRVFDVQINGQVVLKDFDIYQQSGGKNCAISRTFTVDVPDGKIDIFSPKTRNWVALFTAMKIQAGDKTVAVTAGGEAFTDAMGQRWVPYVWPDALSAEQIELVKQGTPLLVMASESNSADRIAQQLSAAGAFSYAGLAPGARATWMGSWIFNRAHPLFDGLPSNEVMKGDYQLGIPDSFGLLVDGPAVEIAAAYGRDHDRSIGAALFTSRLGKGRIVFSTLWSVHPVVAQRLAENQLRYLLQHPGEQP